MNAQDTGEGTDHCGKAASEIMKLFTQVAGIEISPPFERDADTAELLRQVQQRMAQQAVDQQQRLIQNQAVEAENARMKAMHAEAETWYEAMQKMGSMNAVVDGLHWVRFCTANGSRCEDTMCQIVDGRVLLKSEENIHNRSRPINNGRIIVDTTFFDDQVRDPDESEDQSFNFDNLFFYLMFESEIPPHNN